MEVLIHLIKTDVEKRFISMAYYFLTSRAICSIEEMSEMLIAFARQNKLLLDSELIVKYVSTLNDMQFMDKDDCVVVYLELFKPAENA